MNVIEKINEVIDTLNEIDEYSNSLSDKLSIHDGKEQDILHRLEGKINILWCYKVIKELHNNRLERRKVKNDMELLARYNEHKNKLISKENRQFILTELHKREKLLNQPYKNRQYTEEEFNQLFK